MCKIPKPHNYVREKGAYIWHDKCDCILPQDTFIYFSYMIFLFGVYVILMDVVNFYVPFWKYYDNF